MREENNELDRREFMKKGAQATAAAAAAVLGTNYAHGAVPEDKKITFTDAVPTRELGKTKVQLPILGYGGAALPKKWGNTLSFEDRIKLVRHAYDSGIRYFDTAAQVGSMPDDWTKRYPVGLKKVYEGKSARARGDIDPVPQGGGSPGMLQGTPYHVRIALFSPGQYADRVRVPTLLIDAEKEHYFKIDENSERVHEVLKKNNVPTEYHVLKESALRRL